MKVRSQILKLSQRKFISKLKRIRSNTIDSGITEEIKLNEEQVKRKKYLRTKKKSLKLKVKNRREVIPAPDRIDFYRLNDFRITIAFIDKLKRFINKRHVRVQINFDKTELITAAAMLSFLAEVDIIINQSEFGRDAISFTHPKNEKTESILKQVGFYELLGKKERTTPDFEDVSYWNYASGIKSDTQITASAMITIEEKIGLSAKRKLYKGFSEAMANCVEHAYIDCLIDTASQTKWWAFAGVKDDKLVVVICDKGIGIPRSLPLTRSKELISKTLELFKLSKRKDSAMIKVASRMGKTSTNNENRGKGLSDVRAIIDKYKSGSLSIYSNKGCYEYFGKNGKIEDRLREYPASVCGTLVEWSIPLSIDKQKVSV